MLTASVILVAWWLLTLAVLWVWKRALFRRTWNEPYFSDTPVLIESDDWGPGGAFHADRLRAVLECLSRHHDSVGRCALLTADTVLAVPDIPKIRSSTPASYHRKLLDSDFPEIHREMTRGIQSGTLVPQLHGLEHLNGDAFAALAAIKDPRVELALKDDGWWDWESLDSPLQGHYVDGSHLPTVPVDQESAEGIITTAAAAFESMFGHRSVSAVAPCYLWNSDIEAIWKAHGVDYIQTAGYRCTGRNTHGTYLQDPPLIRAGDWSDANQRYLVRNVMYEPVDGRNTAATALAEAVVAFRQAQPISISTHRYNYTRSEAECLSSLSGLDQLLTQIERSVTGVRYLSSPELGICIDQPNLKIVNRFNGDSFPPIACLTGPEKIRPFLYRLKYRHPKLVMLSIITGVILPVGLLMLLFSPSHPKSAVQTPGKR